MLSASIPLSMSCAMMRGMTHFITTSSDTYSGALIDAALYSRMLCIHFLIMDVTKSP